MIKTEFYKPILDKFLPRKSMRRNLAVLASGTAIAQGILFLGLPVLSRFYEPHHFAALAIITTLGSLLGMGATFRYDMALVLPDKHSDAAGLFIVAGTALAVVSLACLIVVFFFNVHLSRLLGLNDYPKILYLLPFAILAIASYFLFENLMVRYKEFRTIAVAKLNKAGATILTPLALILFLPPACYGLVAGYILGFGVAALILAIYSKRFFKYQFFEGVGRHQIWQVICDYRKFPLLTLPQNFINSLSRALPNLLLASLYSPTVLGLFFLGFRAFSGPMGIFTESMAKVFYQRATQEYNAQSPLVPLILKLYKKLFFLIAPLTILLFIFAESLFALVFGTDWAEAGRYLKYILPWLSIMFIVSPSHHVLNILNKQEIFLVYDIILLGLRYVILVAGGVWFVDPAYTLGLYSLVGLFGNIIIAAIILFLADRSDKIMAASDIKKSWVD